MLELLNNTSDTHLLLIGPVTAAWYWEELQQRAEELDLTGRLTVIPGLPPDSAELLQALKCADCFILPSRHEPFGIAALEALDAGVPLIASAVGGLKDFLRHGDNALLFEDNNVEALCQVYAELDAVRTKLIANGKLTAQEYNWQSLAEKLTAIYRELIK